ncbi:hypothetical protein C8Q79DRAFT_522206 [Trametes meyenii]|nr:hypothetical protein C8Q79DRAFT_522206 [Trametes meyenii]
MGTGGRHLRRGPSGLLAVVRRRNERRKEDHARSRVSPLLRLCVCWSAARGAQHVRGRPDEGLRSRRGLRAERGHQPKWPFASSVSRDLPLLVFLRSRSRPRRVGSMAATPAFRVLSCGLSTGCFATLTETACPLDAALSLLAVRRSRASHQATIQKPQHSSVRIPRPRARALRTRRSFRRSRSRRSLYTSTGTSAPSYAVCPPRFPRTTRVCGPRPPPLCARECETWPRLLTRTPSSTLVGSA